EAKVGADGKTSSPYAQKRMLNQNGEFLAEVDRVARAKLNIYYKAKQCRARVDLDYKGNAQFPPQRATASVTTPPGAGKTPLATRDAALTPDKIEQLFTEHRACLYGDDGNNVGAVTCVRDLLDAGITVRSHREIESCNKVEQSFAVLSAQLIDENCMPQ